MASSARPAKRIRQACGPCRRKKARCPGEKPSCSLCERLGQSCNYEYGTPPRQRSSSVFPDRTETYGSNAWHRDSATNSTPLSVEDTAERFRSLERKLDHVIDVVHQRDRRTRATDLVESSNTRTIQNGVIEDRTSHPSISSFVNASSTVNLFFRHCNYQPLPILCSEMVDFIQSQPRELQLVVQAAATRFVSSSIPYHTISACKEMANSLLMERILDGMIELHTIQALCILSWIEFYDGNAHRSSTYSTLASSFMHCAAIAELPGTEALRRCCWSLRMLNCLTAKSLTPSPLRESIAYPTSTRPNRPARRPPDNESDLGILAYALELSEIWSEVANYTGRRASSGKSPPWSTDSEYAKIMEHLMDYETKSPQKYRFKPSGFADSDRDALIEEWDFWAPWLFVQLLYHAIIFCLNHPLLLSLRLRNFQVTQIPEVFLQHTVDLVATHIGWVVYFIDILDTKELSVSDPFLAQCVAIAATIFLQQSFTDDIEIQSNKKDNFSKCLEFIRTLGTAWPRIQHLVTKLERFESIVSTSYNNSAASFSPLPPNDKIFIDLTLFWEILEWSSITSTPDIDGPIFGASLSVQRNNPLTAAAATEVLQSRLLPEPTRIAGSRSHAATPNDVQPVTIQHDGSRVQQQLNTNLMFQPVDDDAAVLAQSYFAAGQDFVGNLDDWWNLA